MLGRDLASYLCLPFKVIREPLKFLKDEKCIQVDGGDLVGEVSYRFSLTDLGRKRAQDAMEQCAYVGPAPVPLEDYVEQSYRQTVTGLAVLPGGAARPPFGHLVSRRRCSTPSARPSSAAESVFIYGPPGNGKTAMARAIGDFMNTAGGSIYIPLRVPRRRQHHHRLRPVAARRRRRRRPSTATRPTRPSASCSTPAAMDQRWVRIRRPVIVTGGELNLDDARPAVQRRGQLLPGPDPLQGQRRRVPDRRLRPAAVSARRNCSTAGFCRWKTGTTS